jgi:hypothetical protein
VAVIDLDVWRAPPNLDGPLIPAHEGDEVDVIEDGNTLRIIQVKESPTRGQRLVHRMRGRASDSLSTDQLMELLRGE